METAGLGIGAEDIDAGDAPETENANRKRARGKKFQQPCCSWYPQLGLWVIEA